MLAVDEGQVVLTIVVAVLAALAGYALRLREWIKDRRLEAYADLAASVDVLATSRARTFSLAIQLGKNMRVPAGVEAVKQEQVDQAVATANEAMVQFRRAAQRASLLSSRRAGKAQIILTQFVSSDLSALPPYGDVVAPSVSHVLESAADAVWAYLKAVVRDIRPFGAIAVASDPGVLAEPPPTPPAS